MPLAERIRHVLRTVSARPFHRPLVAAALYQGTVTLFFLTTGESLLLIGGNAVLGFANLAVGTLLANRFLTPRLERCSIPLRLLVGTGAAVLIAFTGITLFALLSALLGGGPVWVWTVLVSWPVVAALFALAAGLEAERREQEAHLETLGRELAWSTAHVAQRVRHERRLLGAWLHGPTQSALLALVRRLENALPGQLEEVVEAALPDLLTVTESIQHLIDGRDTEPLILDDALGNIVKMWRGALEVRIVDEPAVAERLQADPAALTVVVDVVAEGLANASRHGRAHRADVTLEQVEGSRLIVITVTDDGMYGGNGEPGGGSAFLDQVATSWSIRSIEAGKTELRVVIPCGGPAESGSEYAIGRPLDVSSPLVLD